MSNRVVVTGIGMITAAGNNVEQTWDKVKKGEPAFDVITRFDISGYKASLAAEIKNYDPALYFEDLREVRRLDLVCQYALISVKEAVESSGIDFKDEKLDKRRCGVIYGSGVGGMETIEAEIVKCHEKGGARVSPLYIPMFIANMASGHISIKYGLEGHGFCPVTACSTGSHAIGEAFRAIRHGYADIMIAGGCEAAITPSAIAGFQNSTTLSTSTDKNSALIAFDKRRKGFVMGEGAGAVILESYESAKKRGATIYGEVIGYNANFDAYHITSPDPTGKGAMNAMLGAIEDAKIDKTQIGYINAHGTGTQVNDKFETLAIKSAFGEYANNVPISSTKGVVGHMLGATGAVEAIFCLMALRENVLPPTANLHEPDPECDLDYIPINAREKNIKYALSTSLGFGATNAALVFAGTT
ncbi:polyketide synthase-related [Holotrichia oblita]|nr:polyketide synthase-related [Holotrichia oblita]